MKIVTALMLLVSCISVFSQDCETLNKFRKFHGITIGSKVPDSIRKYFYYKGEFNDVRFDSVLTIEEETIVKYPHLKRWLHFGDYFSDVSLYTLHDGAIYSFMLTKPFTDSDTLSVQKNELPFFFDMVYKELKSLFGPETKRETKNEIWGTSFVLEWECQEIRIDFSFSYKGIFNSYSLSFEDRNLDKKRKLSKYSKE